MLLAYKLVKNQHFRFELNYLRNAELLISARISRTRALKLEIYKK